MKNIFLVQGYAAHSVLSHCARSDDDCNKLIINELRGGMSSSRLNS